MDVDVDVGWGWGWGWGAHLAGHSASEVRRGGLGWVGGWGGRPDRGSLARPELHLAAHTPLTIPGCIS